MPRWLLILILACLARGTAAAQAAGSIAGTVEDAGGQPVPGAQVTLTLAGSSTVYAAEVTSRTGRFGFNALMPVPYDVAIEAGGFKRHTLTNVVVAAGVETPLAPIRLQPDGSRPTETQEPGAGLETGNTVVTASVTSAQVDGLPVARRDPFPLVETLPGVQDNGRAASVYGQSTTVENITLDGVNLQTNFAPPQKLESVSLALHTDQIQEANIVTGALFGCGCSQITFSTPFGRSGFHGSAYWLTIPGGVTAQYWTANSQGTPAATGVNQLGATFGGGLMKNRLFFFLNYEADLDRSSVTRTGEAPTQPLTSQDPLMQKVLNLIPSSASGIYRGAQRNGSTGNLGLGRLDYLASARHTFGLTFAGDTSTTDDPTDSSVFGYQPDTTIHVASRFYAGFWRWAISPTLTNEVHVGASLPNLDFRNSLRGQFGFIAILNDPSVSVSQPMTGMDPRGESDDLYSYQDNLHWVYGKHTWEFGVWIQQYRLNTYGFNDGLLDSLTVPRYVVSNITTGAVTEIDQRFNILSPTSGYSSGTTAQSKLSANMLSGYFHDDWKVFRSLDISLGVRYDYLSPADERTGTAIVPNLSSYQANSVYDQNLTFGFASTHQALYAQAFDHASPHLGFAWKPPGGLPVVVRGAINVSYMPDDLLPNLSIYALENPFQSFNVTTNPGGVPLSEAPVTPTPQLPSTLTLSSLLAFERSYHQPPATVYAIDGDLRTPNVEYWDLGIETHVRGFHLGVLYLGNRLNEAARSVDRNQVMLPPAFLAQFLKVRAALLSGTPTNGFPLLPGGGLCANLSKVNCQPDLHAISLIETGQAGELARWYEAEGYAPDLTAGYYVLGNPIAPGGIDLLSKLGTARYDGLQFTLSRRTVGGVNLAASYVFSKVLSNLDDYQLGAIDPYLYLHNPSLEWAPAPFNQKQAFKLTAIWDMPFFRSRVGPAGKILGNWSLSSIVMAQSGAPFSLLSGGYVTEPNGQVTEVTGLGTLVSQADSGENTVVTSLNAGQIEQFFGIRKNPNGTVSYVNAPAGAFEEPGPATLGNLQRRMFTGPGAFNINLGLRKVIPVREGKQVEFRAETINLLNHVDWLVGDQTFLGNSTTAATFNNNVTQWVEPRTVQFTLRVMF